MTSIISRNRVVRLLLPPLFWLGVWQCAAMGVDNPFLLPGPARVWGALCALAPTWDFWGAALATLGRVAAGLLAGTLLGAALAALTCASPLARSLVSPAMGVVRATPVASFILLLLLWGPRTAVPAQITLLMVLPVVWGNVVRGIQETDGKLLELARTYRFSRWKTVWLIYLPSVRPYFFSALLTATGLGWKAGVAAEVLCQPKWAVGSQIYFTKYYLQTADLFAWTAVVILLSLALERLLGAGLRRLERGWRT